MKTSGCRKRKEPIRVLSPRPVSHPSAVCRHDRLRRVCNPALKPRLWRRRDPQLEVRSLPPQPGSHSTRESGPLLAESTAFYRAFVRLSKVSGDEKTATFARICRKSPAQTAEIPVFVETIAGDRFDHH